MSFIPYYKSTANNKFNPALRPIPIVPIVTEAEKQIGVMFRYFTRASNSIDSEIYEISKQQYENFKNDNRFITLEIPWVIRGNLNDEVALRENGDKVMIRRGVKSANTSTITSAEKKIPFLSSLLNNPLQFYVGI